MLTNHFRDFSFFTVSAALCGRFYLQKLILVLKDVLYQVTLYRP